MVDINTDGGGNLTRIDDNIGDFPNRQSVYAPNHGLPNGAELVYTVSGGPVIGGLSNGGHYWAITTGPDSLGSHQLRLADSECHAGVGTYDADPGAGVDIQPCSSNVQVLVLTPDKGPAGLPATHKLTRFGHESIGLVDGNMYFLNVIDGTDFQLLDKDGNVMGGLVAKQGDHLLIDEGIATVSPGTGTQRLVVEPDERRHACSGSGRAAHHGRHRRPGRLPEQGRPGDQRHLDR